MLEERAGLRKIRVKVEDLSTVDEGEIITVWTLTVNHRNEPHVQNEMSPFMSTSIRMVTKVHLHVWCIGVTDKSPAYVHWAVASPQVE